MNKCFITKLPSSVDNDNLPVLGQLRINWLKQSDLTDNEERAIGLSTNDSITIKVSGAHLTDNTLSSNLGNSKTITKDNGLVWLYVSNDADAILTIDNKYSLTKINFVKPNKDELKRSVKFDINDIRYCTALEVLNLYNINVSGDISAVSQLTSLISLSLPNTNVSGDISAVSQLTGLIYLSISNSQVSGDISAVSQLTGLISLNLSNTNVSGDISAVSNLTALTGLYLENTQVSGDISAVSNLTALTGLHIDNTQVSGDISAVSQLTNLTKLCLNNTQISGDIDSLAGLTKLNSLADLKNTALTGDMSKVPANVNFISQSGRKVTTNFTWTADSRKNATLLAIQGPAPLDTASMDNMLIAQATCTFKPSADSWTKIISVNGTRTSASDAAVATLQSKGVTITGVTKQA